MEQQPLPDLLLDALAAAGGEPRTAAQLLDWIRTERGRRVSRNGRTDLWLERLRAAGLAASVEHGAGRARTWTTEREAHDGC